MKHSKPDPVWIHYNEGLSTMSKRCLIECLSSFAMFSLPSSFVLDLSNARLHSYENSPVTRFSCTCGRKHNVITSVRPLFRSCVCDVFVWLYSFHSQSLKLFLSLFDVLQGIICVLITCIVVCCLGNYIGVWVVLKVFLVFM